MINFTSVVRPWFARICRDYHGLCLSANVKELQEKILKQHLHTARSTKVGEEHNFAGISDYEDFRRNVPVVEYPDIRVDVERMLQGERDILWPGVCKRFAQSSGTSDGKSKYIPVTETSLRQNHYAGATRSVAFYLDLYQNSRLFGGKSLILGGSFANEARQKAKGVKVGDLSAHLIDHINSAVNLVRVPSKNIALMEDWTEKLPRLIDASINEDITNISGVPSWFLTVLKGVIELAGASSIHDVWPNLEVFFHGGISFEPYREQYNHITDTSRMRYLENYNASEGFFAAADSKEARGMRLLTDIGVFYEFVPLDQAGEAFPDSLGAWEVEEGRTYSLIITACNGLWRYAIGDTVRIESVEPLRISVAGRTKSFINAFGEELMVHNAEAAIAEASKMTGAKVADYTAGPVYASDSRKGCHRWLVEWNTPPSNLKDFALALDKSLRNHNSDYDAKRRGDIFLSEPEIVEVPKGTFNRWLASSGKLGGQRKIPRLSNTPDIIRSVEQMGNLIKQEQ